MLEDVQTLPKALIEPWKDEAYHADDFHPRLSNERSARGQRRLAIKYVTALEQSLRTSARLVAEKLRACGQGHRCGSGFCPSCTWAANRWFRATLQTIAAQATEMQFVTIQLPDDRALLTPLEKLKIGAQKALLRAALSNAGLSQVPMLGALDLSRDVWPLKMKERWAAHWALFTWDRSGEALTSALTSVMADHPLVPVPVKTKTIKVTPDRVFSYAFKNVYTRKFIPRTPTRRDVIIRPSDVDFCTLAINLDRIGIMPRVFSQGINIAGGMIHRAP